MAKRSEARPPWKRKNPKKSSTPLSRKPKSGARARARAAGRRYPNLVDNMAVARNRKPKRTRRRGDGSAKFESGGRV
jgi:hypothetical protein